MAGVEAAPVRKTVGVFVVALLAVLTAIVFMGRLSRRPGSAEPAVAPAAMADPPAPAAVTPAVQAAEAPAAAVAPEPADQAEISARKQSEIARVVSDGGAGLKVCYQRALVRDATLVHGNLTVRVSIAPSGRVAGVNIRGPAAFRAVKPCLAAAVSKWTFPSAPVAYQTEFPLVLRGTQ